MGIEGEHGNAGSVDAIVGLERGIEESDLLADELGGESLGYLGDGQMGGNKGYAQLLAGKYHKGLGSLAY